MSTFTDDILLLHDILSETGLAEHVWLFGGAVLGVAREGTLLAHDKDLDFGIEQPSLLAAVTPKILAAGFTGQHVWVNNDGNPTEWVFRRHGRKFEFFRHWRVEDKFRWYAMHGGKKVQLTREMPVYELEKQELLGREWLMPVDLENYLTLQYGDWKTPKPRYNYITDCPCNIDTRKWTGSHKWKFPW